MSSLSEYLKLIPLGIKHREEIVNSVMNKVKKNLNLLTEGEQDEIIKRRLICMECPYNSDNAVKEGYKSRRVDSHCIMCSCNINFKTECLMCNCGIDTWNMNNPNEKLPLKWETYKIKQDE